MTNHDQKGTVLVTGGAKRIGRAVALGLAEDGYGIALHYHTSQQDAEEIYHQIHEMGSRCELFRGDLSRTWDVMGLIPEVLGKCPDLCVLINNASVFQRKKFLETDEEVFNHHFDLNLRAPFFLTQQFAKQVKKGHVINMLDTKISKSSRSYFIYTLTKKSLFEFTRMAAKELGPDIRVNGLAPGLILPSQKMTADEFEKLGKRIPLQRTGSPAYIVSSIRFLINHPFFTGVCLYVDGGEHLP